MDATSVISPIATGYKALGWVDQSSAAPVKAEGSCQVKSKTQFINDCVFSKPSWKLTLFSSPPVSLFKSVSSCLTASIPTFRWVSSKLRSGVNGVSFRPFVSKGSFYKDASKL